jgi:hypothetical protein
VHALQKRQGKKMGMPPREALNSELKKREIMLLSLALFTGPMAFVASQGGIILPVKAGGEIGFGQSLSFSVCYTPFAEHFPMTNTSGLNYWQGSSIDTLAAWSFGDRAIDLPRIQLTFTHIFSREKYPVISNISKSFPSSPNHY